MEQWEIGGIVIGVIVICMALLVAIVMIPRHWWHRIGKFLLWTTVVIVGVFLFLVVFNILAPRMLDRETGEVVYMK
jgi:hypothetical protein